MGRLNVSLFTTGLALSIAGVGCGGHNKTPVSDIQTLRDNGSAEMAKGPVKPQVIKEYVKVEVPRDVIKEKEVIKYVKATEVKEQATVDSRYFTLSIEDTSPFFEEGVEGQVGITAFAMDEGIKVDLITVGTVPEGVKITKTSDKLFVLSWTPTVGTLGSKAIQPFAFKVRIKIVEAPENFKNSNLESIIVEDTIKLVLTKGSGASGAAQ